MKFFIIKLSLLFIIFQLILSLSLKKSALKLKSTVKLKLIIMNGILARDVGCGKFGSTWICGKDGRVYRFDPGDTVHNIVNDVPRCKRIDVDYEGLPWLISERREVWRLIHMVDNNFRWVQVEGCGVDVGCSTMGDCFVFGCNGNKYGFGLFVYDRGTGKFVELDGAGRRLDADPSGAVWFTNNFGNIFKREHNRFLQIGGVAWDITVDNSGNIYHIGNEHSIWSRSGNDWNRIQGYGVSISAGDGLWVVRPDGALLH